MTLRPEPDPNSAQVNHTLFHWGRHASYDWDYQVYTHADSTDNNITINSPQTNTDQKFDLENIISGEEYTFVFRATGSENNGNALWGAYIYQDNPVPNTGTILIDSIEYQCVLKDNIDYALYINSNNQSQYPGLDYEYLKLDVYTCLLYTSPSPRDS